MIGKIRDITDDLSDMKSKVNALKAKRDFIQDEVARVTKDKDVLVHKQESLLKARAFVQKVAEDTQKRIEFQISNLVSTALAAVFPDPYEFKLRFVQRRNKMECDLVFVKNGYETDDILNSGGGGVTDVVSLALRISLWSLKKSRPTFILDEAGKFISREYQEKVSTLLKELSEKLHIQFILVSHIPEIQEAADKVFICENINGVATIRSLM